MEMMSKSLEATKDEIFRQHLKSCTGRCAASCAGDIWHGFDISDNPEMYLEERRKYDQATLARYLKRVNEKRLLTGYNPSKASYASEKQSEAEDVSRNKRETGRRGGSGRKGGGAKRNPLVLEKLVMEKQNKVIKLSNVQLFYPNVGAEETCVGTLETHVNGFLYTSCSSSFHLHCMFKDIKGCFFKLGNNSSPPHLQFHLGTDIKVGKEKTKDLLFNLPMTPDSDEDRNHGLEDFIYNVEDKWMSRDAFSDLGPFQDVGEDMFIGICLERKGQFHLTLFSIVGNLTAGADLEDGEHAIKPFVLVNQEDIEIVNLVEVLPGVIDMTVVCNDFKVDSMVEIRFPSESLAAVKNWLYRGGIKYYVNKVENWKSRVKEIAEDFQTFLERGGWDQYGLEDNATVQDYYSMRSESDSSDTLWGESSSELDSEEEEE